ncbi:DUF1540 domain-containing protein [Fictibacillus nanhaiensis]|uniref:DUF1540 domain-containing protein n=1 Tax=Fictibacillus nanhaiensis TaxID=742169 RepID=UPI003CC7F271
MATEVLCNVENCKYWEEGDKCVADSIYVIGEDGREAGNVMETACKMFFVSMILGNGKLDIPVVIRFINIIMKMW